MKRQSDKTILVIGDPHFPYEAKDFILQMKEARREYQPDIVVCMGDLVDQHGLGRWTPDSDARGNNEEFEDAKDSIKRLSAVFPEMKICLGNHDLRFLKKIKSFGIPSVFARDIAEVYGTPDGWKWCQSLVIDDILFFHGDGFSGQNAAIDAVNKYRQSCVIGHVHAFAGIHYSQGPSNRVFGMNVGCMVDPTSLAFAYARNTPNKPVIGYGVIHNGVPHFIPIGQ